VGAGCDCLATIVRDDNAGSWQAFEKPGNAATVSIAWNMRYSKANPGKRCQFGISSWGLRAGGGGAFSKPAAAPSPGYRLGTIRARCSDSKFPYSLPIL